MLEIRRFSLDLQDLLLCVGETFSWNILVWILVDGVKPEEEPPWLEPQAVRFW